MHALGELHDAGGAAIRRLHGDTIAVTQPQTRRGLGVDLDGVVAPDVEKERVVLRARVRVRGVFPAHQVEGVLGVRHPVAITVLGQLGDGLAVGVELLGERAVDELHLPGGRLEPGLSVLFVPRPLRRVEPHGPGELLELCQGHLGRGIEDLVREVILVPLLRPGDGLAAQRADVEEALTRRVGEPQPPADGGHGLVLREDAFPGRNHGLPQPHHGPGDPVGVEIVALEVVRAGDDVVSHERRLAEVRIDDHHRLEALNGSCHLLGPRNRHHGVLEHDEQHLGGVVLALGEVGEQLCVHARVMPHGVQRLVVEALALDGHLGARVRVHLHVLVAALLRGDHPSRAVVAPDEGVEHGDGPAPLNAVGVLARAAPGVDQGGLGGRQLHGDLLDDPGRDAGDLLRPRGGLALDVLGVLLEADRPVGDEGLVPEPLPDNDVSDGERERPVGPGPNRDPHVSLGRRVRQVRVDHDHARAVLETLVDDSREVNPLQGRGRVPAEDEEVLRLREVRQRTPVAHDRAEGGLAGDVTDVRVAEVVGCPEELAEVVLDVNEGVVLVHPDQLLFLLASLQVFEGPGDLVERLVPGDLLEPGVGAGRSIRVRPLERLEDAVWIVQRHDPGVAPGADRRALPAAEALRVAVGKVGGDVGVARGVPMVRLDAIDDPINHLDHDPVLPATHVAARGDPLARLSPVLLLERVVARDRVLSRADGAPCRRRAQDRSPHRGGEPFDERQPAHLLVKHVHGRSLLLRATPA